MAGSRGRLLLRRGES